jgi:hypothetical protein
LLGLGIGETGLHHALLSLRWGELKVLLHQSYQAVPRVRAVVEHLLAAFEGNADLQFKLAGVAVFTWFSLWQ